jgi:hypothetical protein
MRTRGRIITKAFPTMWSMGPLQPRGLLARVLPRLRKKLPFDAPKVGPFSDGRAENGVTGFSSLDGGRKSLMGRKSVLQLHPDNPGNERGNEPSQVYRQNLPQHVDATYVKLGNPAGLSTQEWVSLRLLPGRGRSPRSSPRQGKPVTWRRGAVGFNAGHGCELSRRKDV